MPIPEEIIDQIQTRSDIVEVISRYVPLKKAGRNYKAPCPFHREKTPSFIVSPDKQIYHCFGCGAGGNVFSFLMRQENIEFPEAVEMLAEKAGVALKRLTPERREAASLAGELYRINELASQFFQGSLLQNASAREYLSSRGLSDATIKSFRIGYAPDSWNSLIDFFKKKGVAEGLLEKAGLVIANEKGGHYDRFRKRIIFPIVDLKGRTLGFGGRVMDAGLPKYMNSPETAVYSKGRSLYGLNFSKDAIKKANYALVVEGYLDFLIPCQAGITNLVATLGTALTVDQIKMLKRFAKTAVMVYDPDEAGETASIRNLDLFISEDVNVYIAELPQGYDPDSYIKKFGAEDFIKVIKSSKNLFDYKIDKVSRRFNINTAHGKAAIAAEMLPTIARLNNAVLRFNMVKRLAEKLGVDEESIREELKKVKIDYSERQYLASAAAPARKSSMSAEKMLVALMLEGGIFVDKIRERLAPEEFRDTSVQELVKAIFELKGKGKEITAARMISHMGNSGSAAVLISEAVSLSEALGDKDRALADCIAWLKQENVKDRLRRLQQAIKAAHESKDEAQVAKLVVEYNALVKSGKA
jgi:DNA primase